MYNADIFLDLEYNYLFIMIQHMRYYINSN